MPYTEVPAHLHGLTLAQANRWGAAFDKGVARGLSKAEAAKRAWGAVPHARSRQDAAPVARPAEPRALERDYMRLLMGRARAQSEAFAERLRDALTDDVLSAADVERLLAELRRVTETAMPKAALARLAEHVGRFATRQAERMGVPIAATARQDDRRKPIPVAPAPIPTAQRDAWISENVRLITGMQDKWRSDVEAVIRQAVADAERGEPWTARKLERAIARESGKFGRHARLIAQDQVNKLNAQVNQYRQQQAGITEYRWSTSRDERVRPTHRRLEGTVQKWSEPPVSEANGERNHPGGAVNCRCIAAPVASGLLAGLGLD